MGSKVALWKVLIFDKSLFVMPVIVFFVVTIPVIFFIIWLLIVNAAVIASVIPSLLAGICVIAGKITIAAITTIDVGVVCGLIRPLFSFPFVPLGLAVERRQPAFRLR